MTTSNQWFSASSSFQLPLKNFPHPGSVPFYLVGGSSVPELRSCVADRVQAVKLGLPLVCRPGSSLLGLWTLHAVAIKIDCLFVAIVARIREDEVSPQHVPTSYSFCYS
jgi:hypothetical protein